MLKVTLSDGVELRCSRSTTLKDLVKKFEQELQLSAVIGAKILSANNVIVDLNYRIESNSELIFLTNFHTEALNIIRHSSSHVLAHAVQRIFPDMHLGIGPVIKNGFFYDFYHPNYKFKHEDLTLIEKEMHEIIKSNYPIIREEWNKFDAIKFFSNKQENQKVELIKDILVKNEKVIIYKQGEFIDLCCGPHVPYTGYLNFFKLTKISGAYWKGKQTNRTMQRIYGTAWSSEDELKCHLNSLLEAEKRDHRKIGRELDLFHFHEESPGLVFWHPNGWKIWQEIEKFMRKIYVENDYAEVKSPQILDSMLWEKTGHLENYKENMFITSSENRTYGLKPMNCPGHIQIFNSELRSYKELPIRYGEFGQCHRNEPSGSLHGIMRVRGFTQDDGHIFCTVDQILNECKHFTQLLSKVYKTFGFEKISYKVATRPEKRIGSDETWDTAENALKNSLRECGLNFDVSIGEGAFYGPKIEYSLEDSLGREWQCGTIQVDFSMPERLDARYIDSNDQRRTPVLLHRAILGSFERFIGILIEHYSGALPTWLSPTQICVCSVSEKSSNYAIEIATIFKTNGIRVELDLHPEKITYKIRKHTLNKVPFIIILGEKEQSSKTISFRGRGNMVRNFIQIEEFVTYISKLIRSRDNGILTV